MTNLMSEQELKAAKSFFNGFKWNKLEAAPKNEVDNYISYLEQKTGEARKALAQAERFRPSYAPAGQPTKSERQAAVQLKQAERMERAVKTVRFQIFG